MPGKTAKLFIIDGHAHIYAAYFAPMRPLTSPSGQPTKAAFVFTTAILGLIEKEKPDFLVVAMDSKIPSFRSGIYPQYKAHRPPMPEDMPGQIEQIERILEALRIPALRIDGYEADDIIGTLAAKASAVGIDTYICSKDKDMLQLLDAHTFTFDIKTGQITDTKKMKEDTGLSPEQFIDVLALQGDAADNVPGVPDVGPKTALEWIDKYQSLENLYRHSDEITGKRGDNLRSFKEQAFLSRRLVTIDRDAPIELDRERFAICRGDRDELARIFTELGFTRLLAQFGLKAVEADKPAVKTIAQQGGLFAVPAGPVADKQEYELIDAPEKFDAFYKQFSRQRLFALDTETTSIDPVRAELVGLSFSFKAGVAYYLPVRAPIGQKRLELSAVRSAIGPVLADTDRFKIGQNLKYDLIVLENAGMPVGLADGKCFDTMVASYCLAPDRQSHSLDQMAGDFLGYRTIHISELIGRGKNQLCFDQVDTSAACRYSAEDADITFQLWQYLSPRLDAQPALKELFERLEMPLVQVLARMESNGVSIDAAILRKMSASIAADTDLLTDKIYALSGRPFNIDSSKQLAGVLFDRLGLPSIRTGKVQRSTDADVLEQLRDRHPIIPLLLEYRQLVKLGNTYVDKLPALINPRTGRVHASFNQTVTATGRLSSSNPNLQNIPVRTELGRRIRSAFVAADKDGVILSADYSQIELRLLAHFSGDRALRTAFEQDRDIHSFVASQIYGVDAGDVTPQMRSKSKAVNFGIIYGQGPFGLSRSIGIPQSEAKRFIDDYFARYSSIRKFMDETIARATRLGYAETILGRRRPINGLTSKNFNARSQAERLTINTVVQGSAADLIKRAMINIQRRIDRDKPAIRMILQIHDELVFELSGKDAAGGAEWIMQEMTSAIKLDVPMKVDVSIGKTWLG